MNALQSSAIVAVLSVGILAACNNEKGSGPSVNAPQPAANAPTLNGSDFHGPDLGGPAPRAPSVNGADVKGPQVNGPSVNLYMNSDKTDAGAANTPQK
jgi:hypothetical protein